MQTRTLRVRTRPCLRTDHTPARCLWRYSRCIVIKWRSERERERDLQAESHAAVTLSLLSASSAHLELGGPFVLLRWFVPPELSKQSAASAGPRSASPIR
jgi:hypothetical protein